MWWLAAIAAVAVLAYSSRAEAIPSGPGTVSGSAAGPPNEQAAKALALRWGGVFAIPWQYPMTIMAIESAFRPGVKNVNDRAMLLGGAYGLMQVTGVTGDGLVKQLRATAHAGKASVAPVLARYTGKYPDLMDPELNTLLGSYYLSKLIHEFGENLQLVAGAYHQGPGKIRSMLAANQPIPSALPPFGKQYVAMAERAGVRYGVT